MYLLLFLYPMSKHNFQVVQLNSNWFAIIIFTKKSAKRTLRIFTVTTVFKTIQI